MTRFRLGILQVNHDKSPEVGDRFPDDAHRFRDLLDRLDIRFDYRIYMTIGGELPDDIDEQDGYLITGSPLSVLDDTLTWLPDLFHFIRQCDSAKKPLIGVCFGHQAVALALGGSVSKRTGGYNVGTQVTSFTKTPSFMRPAQNEMRFCMFHEDEVTHLADGCITIGQSQGCQHASFIKEDHIFCVQAHPEFDDRFMGAILDFCRSQMPEATYFGASESLKLPTDNDVFAQWLGAFFITQRG